MLSIQQSALPATALLQRYSTGINHSDCYYTEVNFEVSQADYIAAFYTTRLFKLERLLLRLLVNKPSTDNAAVALSLGHATRFAAWTVEAQTDTQLLLCDYLSRTRSWLMSTPQVDPANGTTVSRLYFGSAVVFRPQDSGSGRTRGVGQRLLGAFHHLYSVWLLASARCALKKRHASNCRGQ